MQRRVKSDIGAVRASASPVKLPSAAAKNSDGFIISLDKAAQRLFEQAAVANLVLNVRWVDPLTYLPLAR